MYGECRERLGKLGGIDLMLADAVVHGIAVALTGRPLLVSPCESAVAA